MADKDWQKGSGYVQEPKISKDPWSGKDGYAQAAKIEATDPTKSQSFKARRDESKGAEKAAGKRAYSAVGTMDKS